MYMTTIIVYALLFIGLYFQIFLLVTYLEKKPENEEEKNPEHGDVAIIIPCWNEEKTLKCTVESIAALQYPKEKLKIIVVDDGSTDNTFLVANALKEKFPFIEVYRQKNGGKHTAVNLGISKTSSEFVACLDADSFVHHLSLSRMMSLFRDKTVMAVTPAMRVHEPKNFLQFMQRVEYNFGVLSKYIFGRLGAIYVTPGPFSVFRRKVFDDLGGFKQAHNTEDMEIAFRMQANNYKIANCPTAFVYTVTPNTLKKLYRQRVRWITGFLKNSLDYSYLFFKKKYGNLGVLTLPFSVISIFAALYLAATWMYHAFNFLQNKILKFRTVGIDLSFEAQAIDWFYINTQATAFIMLTFAVLTFSILLIAKKMAEGSMKPTPGIVCFMFFYSFIVPIWLTKAVYNTILSRKAPWR